MTTIGGDSFNRTTYPSFSAWTINLFLKWHRNDPVSQKEITRNNVIHGFQNNRNPFIDNPLLAEHIWGNLAGTPWTIASVGTPQELASRFRFNESQQSFSFTRGASINYRVLNVSGQTMRTGNTNEYIEVSVADLTSGMYLLRFETEGVRAVRKFIIP